MKNQGAPGVDEFGVTEFNSWLEAHWTKIRQAQASLCRRQCARWIHPRRKGGVRTLSIPTVSFLPVPNNTQTSEIPTA